MSRMESDGRTKFIFTPDAAAGIRAALEAIQELGEAMKGIDINIPRPSNERPWHKHTLPNRRRR